MKASLLFDLFETCYSVLKVNTAGISHVQSVIHPTGGGNCMNWIVGHLIVSRNRIHALLAAPPAMPEIPQQLYQRGAKPDRHSAFIPFEDLLSAMESSQGVLRETMKCVKSSQLTKANPSDPDLWRHKPLEEVLLFLHFHESYHIGQTGLLRRLLGLQGAIR